MFGLRSQLQNDTLSDPEERSRSPYRDKWERNGVDGPCRVRGSSDTSRRRTDSPVSVRGSSLSAIAYCGSQTVGQLAEREVQEVDERHDGLRLKNGLGGG